MLSYMIPILALVLIMNSTGESLMEMVTNQTVPASTVGTSPCMAAMNMSSWSAVISLTDLVDWQMT